jgi:hypothetical protein
MCCCFMRSSHNAATAAARRPSDLQYSRDLFEVQFRPREARSGSSPIMVPSTPQPLPSYSQAILIAHPCYVQKQWPLLHSIGTCLAKMAISMAGLPFTPSPLLVLSSTPSSLLVLPLTASPLLTKSLFHQPLSSNIAVCCYGWKTSSTSYRPQRTPALDRSYPLRGHPCEIGAF